MLDTVVVAGQAKGRCRPTAGRVEVCNGNYGFNGWLGLAQIWLNGSHITQGATKMNDSYLNSGYSTTNKQHVICQEVGHTFGLDHQDESGAEPEPARLRPARDHLLAPRLDLHRGVRGPTGLAGADNASPVAVERSDRIASSTIVEHYADGSRLITHVLWAIGGPGR